MWRDTARSVRLGPIDWRAVGPLLLFFLHIRLWTLYVAIAAVAVFAVLERYGFTVPVAIRFARITIAGRTKRAVSWWRERKLP
jgi:intracellular multiplication protein IcmT